MPLGNPEGYGPLAGMLQQDPSRQLAAALMQAGGQFLGGDYGAGALGQGISSLGSALSQYQQDLFRQQLAQEQLRRQEEQDALYRQQLAQQEAASRRRTEIESQKAQAEIRGARRDRRRERRSKRSARERLEAFEQSGQPLPPEWAYLSREAQQKYIESLPSQEEEGDDGEFIFRSGNAPTQVIDPQTGRLVRTIGGEASNAFTPTQVLRRAEAILEEDTQLRALQVQDPQAAFQEAIRRAREDFQALVSEEPTPRLELPTGVPPESAIRNYEGFSVPLTQRARGVDFQIPKEGQRSAAEITSEQRALVRAMLETRPRDKVVSVLVSTGMTEAQAEAIVRAVEAE